MSFRYGIEKKMDDKTVRLVFDSEVWETSNPQKAFEFCEVLNENSDSGWEYSVVTMSNTETVERKPGSGAYSETF